MSDPIGESFYYWGNEDQGSTDQFGGTDQIDLVLMLSEQVADLQVQVAEQATIIEQMNEGVMYKAGARKPAGISTRGMTRIVRAPMMKPEAIAKMGIRLGARAALKELGVSVPYIGLIIALTFQAYEGVMKEIAHQAAIDAIKQHEKESRLETEQKFGDAIRKVEEARREQYRSLVS
jgi:hypothetical protein